MFARKFSCLLLVLASACAAPASNSIGEEPNVGGDGKADGLRKQVEDWTNNIEVAEYSLRSGLITGMYAKEVCSCVFVMGLDEEECRQRTGISFSDYVVRTDVVDTATERSVTASGIVTGPLATYLATAEPEADPWQSPVNPVYTASFDIERPYLGCRITRKADRNF